jgi:hypothetical protein
MHSPAATRRTDLAVLTVVTIHLRPMSIYHARHWQNFSASSWLKTINDRIFDSGPPSSPRFLAPTQPKLLPRLVIREMHILEVRRKAHTHARLKLMKLTQSCASLWNLDRRKTHPMRHHPMVRMIGVGLSWKNRPCGWSRLTSMSALGLEAINVEPSRMLMLLSLIHVDRNPCAPTSDRVRYWKGKNLHPVLSQMRRHRRVLCCL